jgi:hypothetical protein
MCFSAEASFAGGVLLSVIGTTAVKKVTRQPQRLFSAIPFLFGFQQFAEGVLWTTLKSGKYDELQNFTTYVFLITALIIWPILIPLSMWFMEESKWRKKILTGLIVIGGALALFYASCLLSYNVSPRIQSFHIQYVDNFPISPVRIAFVFYLVATITPLFISSVRRMWIFGVLIAVSCIVTSVSIWCFFAALISAIIYWILLEPNKRKGEALA